MLQDNAQSVPVPAEGVRALYEVLLGRTPAEADMAFWDGYSAREVGAAILASPEYRQLPGGADPTGAAALRLIATNGKADLAEVPAVAPSPALFVLPFASIADQLGAPSIRTIGGFAVALADELRRRGFAQVAAGLPAGDERATVLVTTGPSDLDVVAQVRPDIVEAAQRVLVPHEVPAQSLPAEARRAIHSARTGLHRLGFAEVLHVYRIPHGGPVVIADISDMAPPSGLPVVRTVTGGELPLASWMIANRVPFAEDL